MAASRAFVPAAVSCLLSAVSGCGFGLDPLGGDTGVADATAAFRVDSVEPDWGPTAGGTSVRLAGAGFEGQVAVWFGGAQVDVTVVDAGELLVTSPATSAEVSVDLTVVSDHGELVLPAAFTYSDSGPPDDGDSGSGGSGGDGGGDGGGGGGANAGLTRGYVEFLYEVIGCPSCFGTSGQLSVSAQAFFHEPVAGSWLGWFPAKGTCSSDADYAALSTASVDVGEWVYLESGTLSHGLRRDTAFDGRTIYEIGNLGQSDWTRYADWDVTVADGGSLGPFTQTGALRTTYGFDSITPIDILNDGNQAFTAQIPANNARLTWSPTGIADSMLAIIDVYNANGSSYLGRAACHVEDTGSVSFPANLLSGYPSNAALAIFLYRYQVEETVLAVDGSTIEGISSIGLVGTGRLR